MEDRDDSPQGLLEEHRHIFQCPGCGAELQWGDARITCLGCHHVFAIEDGIPMLFWSNDWGESRSDVTDTVRAFYEETPFPNYDEFDSVASLSMRWQRSPK